MIKKTLIALAIILIISLIYLFTYIPPISSQHGVVESELFLGDSANQPLIVAFGGGGGGNEWARDYMQAKRDSLKEKGYALLAIGYFNYKDAPEYLDRISLDAIADTIMNIAKHSQIDATQIALMGGSRGGELVLNLASRFSQFNAVIALSTSHVSFPAITWSANTSSWTFKNEEVPYVPALLSTIGPALKGDLYTAHTMMLEDELAVKNAEIAVENINGPILIVSGKQDDQWPATSMSDRIMERLQEHDFKYSMKHVALEGGHIAPLDRFDLIYNFLELHLPVK